MRTGDSSPPTAMCDCSLLALVEIPHELGNNGLTKLFTEVRFV